ncbi:unnamed protein product [Linum trigynum]|uniref:HTH OST-type domain-containing protein n=1 Tax=Linum trigynum TaxID=586398 RepID=A0AAV2GKX6_9ROSI
MADISSSSSMIPAVSSELGGMQVSNSNQHMVQPSMIHQNRTASDGPVAILWDIENCPVPSDVRPEDVGGNIRMALQVHPVIKGAVMTFSAYGDFNAFPRRLREGCQRTGVKLIDVPNGRKDAADKAILVDMFLFALDNPPPSSIMLISGDVDFAPALHILGQRGYTIILVIPSGVGVSSALCNAGKFVWDWPSVCRGEGFMARSKSLMSPHGLPVDLRLMGCHINESPEYQNEEEAIVYRGVSQSYYNSRDLSLVSHSLAEYSSGNLPNYPTGMRTQSLPNGMSEVPSAFPAPYDDQYSSVMWVQPGDVHGLKTQLVKLLELFSGYLPLQRIPSEYQKMYGRPLYVSEYGASKLVNLFSRMNDVISIDGKGKKKFVYLQNWKAGPSAPPLIVVNPSSLSKKDRKGKGAQEGLEVAGNGFVSSDEFSDDDGVGVEELEERRSPVIQTSTAHVSQCEEGDDGYLEQFKFELQEILVSYSCRIFLGSFEAIYQQRYKKRLDLQCFGVTQLEELFDKVRDVVVLHEDPTSKRKFVDAISG